MRVLNSQEVLAVTGAHGVSVKVNVVVGLPKLNLASCFANLIAKIKACKPVCLPKPTCGTTTPTTPDAPETPDTPEETPEIG